MKHYSYYQYDPDPAMYTVVTLSEQEILDEYWDYWKERMEKKFKKEFKRDRENELGCITDWCVVNWAWESLKNEQQDNVAKVKEELEHIRSPYTLQQILDLYCKGDYNAELLLQHSLKILINNLEFSQTNTNITTAKNNHGQL